MEGRIGDNFFLLKHFRHGVKISFPFYIYTSMSKGIEGSKEKPVTNPTLHEGLLLLFYKFLKTQTRGKSLGDPGSESEDTTSLDSEHVQVIKIEDEENPSIPSRKSPRSHPPFPPSLSLRRRKLTMGKRRR